MLYSIVKTVIRVKKSCEIRFFRFPKDQILCKKWVHFCCRSDKFNVKTARMCSLHFDGDDFERDFRAELIKKASKNNDSLKITKLYLKKLYKLAENVNLDENVKQLFFRSRLYFRIKNLNIELKEVARSRKRKFNKIVH